VDECSRREGSGDKGGYGKYMRGVEEDFRVRAHWDVSWEKHRECLRGLGKVRERLLKSTWFLSLSQLEAWTLVGESKTGPSSDDLNIHTWFRLGG
jgi:hypothetical protein